MAEQRSGTLHSNNGQHSLSSQCIRTPHLMFRIALSDGFNELWGFIQVCEKLLGLKFWLATDWACGIIQNCWQSQVRFYYVMFLVNILMKSPTASRKTARLPPQTKAATTWGPNTLRQIRSCSLPDWAAAGKLILGLVGWVARRGLGSGVGVKELPFRVLSALRRDKLLKWPKDGFQWDAAELRHCWRNCRQAASEPNSHLIRLQPW